MATCVRLDKTWVRSLPTAVHPETGSAKVVDGVILDATVADQLDVDAMIARYRGRAEAVRNRSLPPVAGEERRRFIQQAEEDYMDYSLVGAAKWSVEEGHLVLRIPLGGRG